MQITATTITGRDVKDWSLDFFFISDLTCEKCKFIPYGMAVQLLPVNNRYIFGLKQYKVKHFPAINP